MKNLIIVPFDLNTARKIKNGEIEGSVLIDNIEIEFVYESKDCAGPYNLLFVRKDGYGISAIYANTEGCTIGGTTLELKVEAGAYFKKGDVLTSTNGYQFIYDGIITKLVARNPKLKNLLKDGEYIPSLGQLNLMAHYMDELNKAFAYVSASPLSSTWYRSSTESSPSVAWYVDFSIGSAYYSDKYNSSRVRAVIDF